MQVDANIILNRLKEAYGLGSDSALARELGVNRTTPAGWRTRNSPDFRRIFEAFPDINLNWLVRGIGRPKLTELRIRLQGDGTTTEEFEDDLDVPIIGRILYTDDEPPLRDYLRTHGTFLRDWLESTGQADPERCFVTDYRGIAMYGICAPGDLIFGEYADRITDSGIYVFWTQGNTEIRHVRVKEDEIHVRPNYPPDAPETLLDQSWSLVGSVIGILHSKLYWGQEWRPPERPQ